MSFNPRDFSCTDPFGATWKVQFLWHQVGIAIRHADTIDCKFLLTSPDEQIAKVVAIPHPALKDFAKENGREISDAWVIRLAANHIRYMIESGEDMEKSLVTLGMDDLRRSQKTLAA